jgi:NADPH:quinone reductase-like Zn-dependent oxidoreductase
MTWPAWQAVISAADTPDDDARSRLAVLLRAIRSRGVLVRPGGQECVVWDMRAHADLPVFGAQMRETWNVAPPARPAVSRANLNAFAAQLTTAGIDFSLYAIWASQAARRAADLLGRDQVGLLQEAKDAAARDLTTAAAQSALTVTVARTIPLESMAAAHELIESGTAAGRVLVSLP